MYDFESIVTPKIAHVELDLDDYDVILVNTGDDHTSLTQFYSEIKDEMASIAKHFGKTVLREVNVEEFYGSLKELKKKYGGRAVLRAIHYFDENETPYGLTFRKKYKYSRVYVTMLEMHENLDNTEE